MHFETPIAQPAEMPATLVRRSVSMLRARMFLYVAALDCTCIAGGFILAAILRGNVFEDSNWLILLTVLLPVYLATALNARAYASANLQDPFRAIASGLQSLAIAVGAVIFVAFYLRSSTSLPRLTITLGCVLTIILMAIARYVFVRHMRAIIGGNPFSVILLCDDGVSIDGDGYIVVYPAEIGIDPDVHDPAMYDRLARMLGSADRVVVSCAKERRIAWASALKGANVQSEIVVPELMELAPLGIADQDGTPTVIVANGPLGLTDRSLKRAFDLIVASVTLLMLLPVFGIVALLIKIDSPGPVFFRQVRIGRGNEMFRMFKFRSMKVEESDGAGHRSASRDDDRITRFGAFIRRTSIDELPQLLNILRGDMSIVGPRPHALGSRAAQKLFWEVDQRYWHRHAAKPGLTGLAQVRGFRGATFEEDDLLNRLQADLEYLERWSIWRDLKIIVLTFRVLLHRNAF